MITYEFIKVYELDYTQSIVTIKAKDLHQAMMLFYSKYNDYDIIAINGVWS